MHFRQGQKGRIVFILLHKLHNERRVFLLLSLLSKKPVATDAVLNLPIWRFEQEELIVGLPAVRSERLYMLPVLLGGEDADKNTLLKINDEDADAVLQCTWEVRYA